MTSILSQDPPAGTVPYGEVLYYDDGTESLGTVTQVVGGDNRRGIPRQETIVADPRLFSDSTSPSEGTFGSNAEKFISDLSAQTSSTPVLSARQFILQNQREFQSAVNDLTGDSTIHSIAQQEAALNLSPAQVLARIIGTGIGAGVLTEAAQVANTAGLSTGVGVIGVEAGAVALTLGAVAKEYDNMTGNHLFQQVQSQTFREFVNYAYGSQHHSTF